MKKLALLFVLLILSAVTFQFISCSEDTDCSTTSRRMMNVGFYKKSNTAIKDTIDTLTITAGGTDSVIVNTDLKVTAESLPLRWTADSTKLIFHYGSTGGTDTLVIFHTNTASFVSMECGYTMEQSISKMRYTKNLLDSAAISFKTANTNDIQNIKLYY